MRFIFLITVAVMITYSANGQTCTCESNFEWVKKTFEENDAGFQYILEKKGQTAYSIHNQLTLEKVKTAKTLTECTKLLYEWLKFFRSGHIGIESLINETTTSTSQNVSQTSQTISQTAQNPEIWNGNISQFEKYIETKKEVDLEGVWESGGYKIGIQKEGSNYVGFIIESDIECWMEELNATTLYLRIPSFGYENKSAIDQVLAENKEKILKTENLIIDVRNNGGGADQSFSELLPFLYTNPIKTIGVEYLISPIMKNQYLFELSTVNFDDMDEETRQWAKRVSDKLEGSKLGEFVNLYGDSISIYQQSTVFEYPKNIGIIVDGGCGSTTEQFLLAAKQSKKVKLFGTSTYGALDISNLTDVESPCKEFRLWYCMSRSLRIPEFAIDGVGLQPDYYLDKSIPQHQWVEFVNEILNQ